MPKPSDPGGVPQPGARPGTRPAPRARTGLRRAIHPVRPPDLGAAGDAGHAATTSGRHQLTIASMALLLFAVASAAAGQVMLKHGMQIATARAHAGRSLALSAATSPWVLLGLAVFGISAIAWLTTLSRVPLSVAYPFNALGYLGILTASAVVLHERTNVATWIGSLLVVSGLIMVVLARP
jgi:drug/metabolite transporter (DMT)-like permease